MGPVDATILRAGGVRCRWDRHIEWNCRPSDEAIVSEELGRGSGLTEGLNLFA
jgi:hypothetical protein